MKLNLAKVIFAFICLLLPTVGSGAWDVFTTKDEALDLYFKKTEKQTAFLSAEQVAAIQKRGKTKVLSKVVTYYIGKNKHGNVEGYAFFETRQVRTKNATYMIVVNTNGTLRGIEILAFYEPEDYKPPHKWMGIMNGKSLDNDLMLKSGVANIVGATLTAQALSDAVRQFLAIYEIAVKGKC